MGAQGCGLSVWTTLINLFYPQMARSLIFMLLLFVPTQANQDIPGLSAALSGIVSPADYEVNLTPPAEKDVEASLDAIVKAEDAKRQSSDNDFAMEKQRMIDAEKAFLGSMAKDLMATRN